MLSQTINYGNFSLYRLPVPKLDVDTDRDLNSAISTITTPTPPEILVGPVQTKVITSHYMSLAYILMVTYGLWHQFMLKLFEFFDHPLSKPYRVDVYAQFVRDFETKLNQLRLVEMGVKVSKEIDSTCNTTLFSTIVHL